LKRWPNNALRDSYCSYHYQRDGSADRTSDNAGHSIEMLKEHYRAIVSPEDTVRFWNIFPTTEGRAEIRLVGIEHGIGWRTPFPHRRDLSRWISDCKPRFHESK
jgi:hypothetical protein